MGKLGKSILSSAPPKPRKLSKAQIKKLEEFQERQRELAEQEKAKKMELKKESGTQKLKSMEAPEGVTNVKDERLGGLASLMKGMSRPEDEADTKPDSKKSKTKKRKKKKKSIRIEIE